MVNKFLSRTKNWKDILIKLLIYDLAVIGLGIIFLLIIFSIQIITGPINLGIINFVSIIGFVFFAYLFGNGIAKGTKIKKVDIIKNVAGVYILVELIGSLIMIGGKILELSHLSALLFGVISVIVGSARAIRAK